MIKGKVSINKKLMKLLMSSKNYISIEEAIKTAEKKWIKKKR